MTTENFFNTQLHVHFTDSELRLIMSALAELSFREREEHRDNNAAHAWSLRTKVKNFVSIYEHSAVL